MVNVWIEHNPSGKKWYESDDHEYQIVSTGMKDHYAWALYRFDSELKAHCRLKHLGKLEECKNAAIS
jgi:hypothetical protein